MYGRIHAYTQARQQGMVPLGIASGGTVTKDVAKGTALTYETFTADASTFVYRLRMMQDALIAQQAQTR